MSVADGRTTQGGNGRAAAGLWSGTGWWWPVIVVSIAGAFVPIPWIWPPESAKVFLPPLSDLPLVSAVLFTLLAFVTARPWLLPPGRAENVRIGWCLGFVLVQVILLRLSVEMRPFIVVNWGFNLPAPVLAWPWIVPVGLATILFGLRHGFLVALATAGLAAIVPQSGTDPLISTGLLVAAFFGVLSLRRCPLRWHIIRGCFRAGAVFGVVGLITSLIASHNLRETLTSFGVPFGIGILSGLLLLVLLPFAEWLTGSLSDVTLIEFGSEHRLLDKLRSEAPGTWNHSINVADLAETAARAIGANALFCRAAALFHDIGKTGEPEIFAENQRGVSPHDALSPQESAEKIIRHVTYGLELAQKHRLPGPFRDIIAEHHGTSLVRYFYARAIAGVEDAAERERLSQSFRYPGPPPSSRESGILALADTVEAAARSAADLDEARIRDLVLTLVGDRIKEGELRDCPLTLAELTLVQESFVATLVSRHHKRPSYPKSGGTQPAPEPPSASTGPAVKKLRSKSPRR